ncbi:MAG TPA: hypothetical protein VF064_12650, partial [Pyrinomonadaceae bacterium]
CTNNLKQLGLAQIDYFRAHRLYASSFEELGLSQPADGERGAGRQVLNGVVIAQTGIGRFAGTPGTGRVTFDWRDGFDGPFDATFNVNPFAKRRRE